MLDEIILGTALYNSRDAFNDKTLQQLIDEYGTLENVRLQMAISDANEIINHFKAAGVVNVTVATTGTATAQTGTGTGTIE